MKKTNFYYLIFAFFSFIIPFLFYYLTANRHITFTDNGELMAVCRTLGIAHPTGYPLFTILGHLWFLLPLGVNKVFQMNLFSAFWTALSSLLFYFSSNKFLKILSESEKFSNKIKGFGENQFHLSFMSLISTFVYSFGIVIWNESTSLEVYSLQLFLFNTLFFIIFLMLTNNFEPKFILVLGLVLGLSFSNHLTTILFVPVILFLFLFEFNNSVSFTLGKLIKLLPFAPFFVLGLSLYLYLPIRSSQLPLFNWGWVSRSFDKFWYHVSGKQYRVWMFSSADVIGVNFEKFLDVVVNQFHWLGLPIIVIGILFLFSKNRYLFWILLISLSSCLFYSLNYQIHDIETYFSLAVISLSFFLVAGIHFIRFRFGNYYFFAFIIPLLLLFGNYKKNDESNQKLVEAYTRALVDNLDTNAVIISAQWDYFCSAFWYLQQIENYRSDVVLIEKELLRRTWYLEQLRKWYPEVTKRSQTEINQYLEQLELFESEKPYDPNVIQVRFNNLLKSFIEKNIDERPIYVTFDILSNSYDAVFLRDYHKRPDGFAIKIFKEVGSKAPSFTKINIDEMIRSNYNINDHLVRGIFEVVRINLTNLYYYALQNKDTTIAKEYSSLINKLPIF
ncbi:MAG: glycosyltransferase family 117 protein [Candidatus Kapaibacteriales bacterium]